MRGVRGAIAIEAPPAYAISPVPRILEGDCLDVLRNDVEPQSVDLIFTSPPYADQRKSAYGGVRPDDYGEWFLPRAEAMRNCLKPPRHQLKCNSISPPSRRSQLSRSGR